MKAIFKIFELGGKYYVYDRNTNKILCVTKELYEFIGKRGEKSEEQMQNILNLQNRGFLQESRLTKIEHPVNNFLKNFEEEKVTQLILQVTQDCNLRCEYCYYVNEDYRNRHHSKLNMDESVALKAIDYLLEHSMDKNEIILGFYGGEPLLRFDLIKKCIEYTEKNVQDRKVSFSLTTNGTLLRDEIIEYFIKQDVSIFISLDGMKETHDRNRKFANGSGSFDVVMAKVSEVKRKYPDYFKKIYFNTVISPDMDMNCVREYYEADAVLSDAHFTSSTIQEFYTDNPVQYDDKLYIDSLYEEFRALLVCAGRLSAEDIPFMYRGNITDIRKMQQSLHKDFLLPSSFHHGGPCVAGSRRLFVDVHGEFYPCERVSEQSSVMHLGNLESGIDLEKVKTLLNVGKITENECLNCWALVHCRVCAAWADNLENLDKKKKLSACSGYKNSILNSFKNVCALNQFINRRKTHE